MKSLFFIVILILILFSFLKDESTPLYIASQKGHVEVVKELLKGNASIDFMTFPLGLLPRKESNKIF